MKIEYAIAKVAYFPYGSFNSSVVACVRVCAIRAEFVGACANLFSHSVHLHYLIDSFSYCMKFI